MAHFLARYKGMYRVKAHIDENTNDYPRDVNGNIETDDLYIPCAFNCQIYHYGHTTLVAYIPSLGRGHNILKALGKRICCYDIPDGETWTKDDYDELYAALINDGTVVRGISENDEEIEIKFNAKQIDLMAEYLKPSTYGAGISPFSTRNLPKSSYSIPDDDLATYKKITASVGQADILLLSHVTRDFINNVIAKTPQYKSKNIKAEMKRLVLKGKNFIHYTGYWDDYLIYLKKEIEKFEESKTD